MKTFVVNLDKDRERWAHVERQLGDVGLDFERMRAVYGRSLAVNELALHYDAGRARWRQARTLTAAEIGCALSHLKTYREVSRRGLPRALILEDDVVPGADIARLLSELEPHLPSDRPVVCLLSPAEPERNGKTADLSRPFSLHRFGSGYFTSSYIVTRAAAELLLAQLHPVGDVADCWGRLAASGKIRMLNVMPAAIVQDQDQFASSTTNDIQALLSASRYAMLRYKFTRARNILLGRLVEPRLRSGKDSISAMEPHPIDKLAD